ncbi:hypothetical protein [Photobacterium indicum]|uniref:hypothetical protein n=1 Tax=Photobacterium indicum TaxID=81447 RepID=UPI003D139F51
MLSFEPNIIIIDDKKEEVAGILHRYQTEGVGTKFFNADIVDGDEKPDSPYSNVNLIFLDLYYQDDFDVELCTGWIEEVIPENSFYVLVIWSKDTQHKEAVLEDLKKINRKPYLCLAKQKTDYNCSATRSYDFDKLYSDIQSKIDEHPELEELALWKKSVQNSSNIVLGHLSLSEIEGALKTKLQKIIVGHGGSSYISAEESSQKREVLFDALDDVLISNAKGARPTLPISNVNETNLYSISATIQSEVDTKLNSWFHFKLQSSPLEPGMIIPGLICKFSDSSLIENYGMLDDARIKSLINPQLVLASETDNNPTLVNVAILLSRPCDIAQNKFGKNLKLISGVLVQQPKRKGSSGNPIKTGKKVDSIKIYDHLYLSEENKDNAIIIDFRYSFSVPKKTFKDNFFPITAFNKDLLSEIQVEYGAYSSRLGITQII